MVPAEFAGSNCHALIIVATRRNEVRGPFLSWVLNSPYGFHALKSIQTGALHPHLNCTFVREVPVPVPPAVALPLANCQAMPATQLRLTAPFVTSLVL